MNQAKVTGPQSRIRSRKELISDASPAIAFGNSTELHQSSSRHSSRASMPVIYPQRQRWVEAYIPPWYTRPRYYVPLGALLALLIGGIIYLLILISDLSSQAATYDL